MNISFCICNVTLMPGIHIFWLSFLQLIFGRRFDILFVSWIKAHQCLHHLKASVRLDCINYTVFHSNITPIIFSHHMYFQSKASWCLMRTAKNCSIQVGLPVYQIMLLSSVSITVYYSCVYRQLGICIVFCIQ